MIDAPTINQEKLQEAITVIEAIPSAKLAPVGHFRQDDIVNPVIALCDHWDVQYMSTVGVKIAGESCWELEHIVDAYEDGGERDDWTPQRGRDQLLEHLRSFLTEGETA